MVGIVDYNAGNITSVEHALRRLGTDFLLSGSAAELGGCDRLIFPGVGEASYAMEQLRDSGLDGFLREWASAGRPLLGICLGSQIIFDWSEEGNVRCLGLLGGKIRRFDSCAGFLKHTPAPDDACASRNSNHAQELKIPHIGWNDIHRLNGGTPLLEGIPDGSDFYFVHSYVICPDNPSVVRAVAEYGVAVPAVIQCGNIFACQFHPEKSGEKGLRILENFCR